MRVFTIALAGLACVSIATAQKPKPGPAVQMPGDAGKIGVPYRLGSAGEELVFTLDKVEFASRVILDGTTAYAEPTRRLLVVTYSVQNPGKADRFFFNQSFSFTVVSPDDKNFVTDGVHSGGFQAYHPQTRVAMSMQLKPAQKVQAIAMVQIHPTGPVNKLIMQRGKGTPVLRYDLRDKVKPMTGPFASADGLGIMETGKAKVATPFELGPFDVIVEKVEESAAAVGGLTPETGNKLIIVTVSAKNVSRAQSPLQSSILMPKMLDNNGEEMKFVSMSKMSTTDNFNQTLEPDQQVRFRFVFEGAAAVKPASILIKEYFSSRGVSVSLGS